MTEKIVLRFDVDPNDGDNYTFDYPLDSVEDAKPIIEAINRLPRHEHQCITRNGIIKSTVIRFDEQVASAWGNDIDGLELLRADPEDDWTPEEIAEEPGLISDEDYKLLRDVFAHSNDDGFHTIHGIKLLRLYEPDEITVIL